MVEDLPRDSWPVVSSQEEFGNWLITVRNDKVRMPDDQVAERTVVTHLGAVAVLALDDENRVLMIRQYRHPVGRQLWEIPAGLRDAQDETLVDTARRELLEETGYSARDWHALVDSYASPGITTERIRIFLARGLAATASDYQREGEEKFLRTAWVPLTEAVLAAYIASSTGFSGLRPAGAPEI
jgi:ADP-ribose pyrophosphatase